MLQCVICHLRSVASPEDEFCKPCATELATDMAEIWGFNGPAVRSFTVPPHEAAAILALAEREARVPRPWQPLGGYMRCENDWGTGCTSACGHCGACT